MMTTDEPAMDASVRAISARLRMLSCQLLCAIALGLSVPSAAMAEQGAQKVQPELATGLVRLTLAAVQNGNATGNYDVLLGLGAEQFRKNITPSDLSEKLSPLRSANIDLTSALLPVPVFSRPLVLTSGTTMLLEGYVPTRPLQTFFVFHYGWEQGRWRIMDLAVNVRQSAVQPPPQPKASDPKPRQTPRPKPKQVYRSDIPRPTTKW